MPHTTLSFPTTLLFGAALTATLACASNPSSEPSAGSGDAAEFLFRLPIRDPSDIEVYPSPMASVTTNEAFSSAVPQPPLLPLRFTVAKTARREPVVVVNGTAMQSAAQRGLVAAWASGELEQRPLSSNTAISFDTVVHRAAHRFVPVAALLRSLCGPPLTEAAVDGSTCNTREQRQNTNECIPSSVVGSSSSSSSGWSCASPAAKRVFSSDFLAAFGLTRNVLATAAAALHRSASRAASSGGGGGGGGVGLASISAPPKATGHDVAVIARLCVVLACVDPIGDGVLYFNMDHSASPPTPITASHILRPAWSVSSQPLQQQLARRWQGRPDARVPGGVALPAEFEELMDGQWEDEDFVPAAAYDAIDETAETAFINGDCIAFRSDAHWAGGARAGFGRLPGWSHLDGSMTDAVRKMMRSKGRTEHDTSESADSEASPSLASVSSTDPFLAAVHPTLRASLSDACMLHTLEDTFQKEHRRALAGRLRRLFSRCEGEQKQLRSSNAGGSNVVVVVEGQCWADSLSSSSHASARSLQSFLLGGGAGRTHFTFPDNREKGEGERDGINAAVYGPNAHATGRPFMERDTSLGGGEGGRTIAYGANDPALLPPSTRLWPTNSAEGSSTSNTADFIRTRHSAALVGANAALNALKVRLSLSPGAIARCISTATPSMSAAASEEEEGGQRHSHRQFVDTACINSIADSIGRSRLSSAAQPLPSPSTPSPPPLLAEVVPLYVAHWRVAASRRAFILDELSAHGVVTADAAVDNEPEPSLEAPLPPPDVVGLEGEGKEGGEHGMNVASEGSQLWDAAVDADVYAGASRSAAGLGGFLAPFDSSYITPRIAKCLFASMRDDFSILRAVDDGVLAASEAAESAVAASLRRRERSSIGTGATSKMKGEAVVSIEREENSNKLPSRDGDIFADADAQGCNVGGDDDVDTDDDELAGRSDLAILLQDLRRRRAEYNALPEVAAACGGLNDSTTANSSSTTNDLAAAAVLPPLFDPYSYNNANLAARVYFRDAISAAELSLTLKNAYGWYAFARTALALEAPSASSLPPSKGDGEATASPPPPTALASVRRNEESVLSDDDASNGSEEEGKQKGHVIDLSAPDGPRQFAEFLAGLYKRGHLSSGQIINHGTVVEGGGCAADTHAVTSPASLPSLGECGGARRPLSPIVSLDDGEGTVWAQRAAYAVFAEDDAVFRVGFPKRLRGVVQHLRSRGPRAPAKSADEEGPIAHLAADEAEVRMTPKTNTKDGKTLGEEEAPLSPLLFPRRPLMDAAADGVTAWDVIALSSSANNVVLLGTESRRRRSLLEDEEKVVEGDEEGRNRNGGKNSSSSFPSRSPHLLAGAFVPGTAAYAVSLRGALKLLQGLPTAKPVDLHIVDSSLFYYTSAPRWLKKQRSRTGARSAAGHGKKDSTDTTSCSAFGGGDGELRTVFGDVGADPFASKVTEKSDVSSCGSGSPSSYDHRFRVFATLPQLALEAVHGTPSGAPCLSTSLHQRAHCAIRDRRAPFDGIDDPVGGIVASNYNNGNGNGNGGLARWRSTSRGRFGRGGDEVLARGAGSPHHEAMEAAVEAVRTEAVAAEEAAASAKRYGQRARRRGRPQPHSTSNNAAESSSSTLSAAAEHRIDRAVFAARREWQQRAYARQRARHGTGESPSGSSSSSPSPLLPPPLSDIDDGAWALGPLWYVGMSPARSLAVIAEDASSEGLRPPADFFGQQRSARRRVTQDAADAARVAAGEGLRRSYASEEQQRDASQRRLSQRRQERVSEANGEGEGEEEGQHCRCAPVGGSSATLGLGHATTNTTGNSNSVDTDSAANARRDECRACLVRRRAALLVQNASFPRTENEMDRLYRERYRLSNAHRSHMAHLTPRIASAALGWSFGSSGIGAGGRRSSNRHSGGVVSSVESDADPREEAARAAVASRVEAALLACDAARQRSSGHEEGEADGGAKPVRHVAAHEEMTVHNPSAGDEGGAKGLLEVPSEDEAVVLSQRSEEGSTIPGVEASTASAPPSSPTPTDALGSGNAAIADGSREALRREKLERFRNARTAKNPHARRARRRRATPDGRRPPSDTIGAGGVGGVGGEGLTGRDVIEHNRRVRDEQRRARGGPKGKRRQ